MFELHNQNEFLISSSLTFSPQSRALRWPLNPSWTHRWQLNPQSWHATWPTLPTYPWGVDWVSNGSTPHFLVLLRIISRLETAMKPSTDSLIVFYLSNHLRYRWWSSDLKPHWLLGRQRQPIARVDVLGAAEEWGDVSDQSPAQHVQTAHPPHTGNKTENCEHNGWWKHFLISVFTVFNNNNMKGAAEKYDSPMQYPSASL